jgi:2-polyprenyl-3-methyl-5-hydroxy-6-metoxy-1,4-benzoquinol methylase
LEDKLIDLDIKNDKVFLGIPIERFLMPEFVDNEDAIKVSLHKAGLLSHVMHAQGHRVDRNRDKLVAAFLRNEEEPDWLLMLDSDMKHPVDCGLRLLAHRVPVVGALYFHRMTHEPLVFKSGHMSEDEYGRETLHWDFMQDEVYEFLAHSGLPFKDDAFTLAAPGPSLLECEAVGTGCMMIHRSVLEAMEPPWFEYRSGSRSEDIEFCYRVRTELGLPVHADMSTICGHYSLVPMGQAQFRQKFRGRGITAGSYSEDDAVGWLEEFAGMQDADRKMAEYHPRQLAKLWAEHEELVASDLEFYEKAEVGRMYLMDLLWWNASPLFADFRNALVDVRDQKAIIIGSGIGTIAIQLAVQGCDVLAIEPNGILRDFSKKRWNQIRKRIRTNVGKLVFKNRFARGQKRNYQFDLGVAIDVLEHMEENVLVNTMQMFSNNIKSGGKLFVHNNWEQQDLYPMHRDHSELWPQLVEANGFVQTGGLWLTRIGTNIRVG